MESCTICGETKVWKEGGTRKDGTQYDGFMACPNYRNHPKQPDRGGFQPVKRTGEAIILEELVAFRKEINERLDNMANYFATKGKV